MMTFFRRKLSKVKDRIKLQLYWLKVPRKAKKIRKKSTIRVLFVLSELSCWKTELLYKRMKKHSRFEPIIGVSTVKYKREEKEILISYLLSRRYEYVDLDASKNAIETVNPDIIFYYKPYASCYSEGHYFYNNMRYLFCGLDYCFSVTKHEVHIVKEQWNYCWQFYVEHQDVADRKIELLGRRSQNVLVTGVPMQDILLLPKSEFKDPWKDKTGKKRIIYAPHHSIKGTNGDGVEFATFLDFGEIILELATKYGDNITVAFKPHPNLYMKLVKIWGKQRTDDYYRQWELLPNTQLETGEYVGLFKYSDAIIHDSASFIVEYLFMDNPAMYLVADTNNMDEMFNFVQLGFHCYEHAHSSQEIESFIQRVISGNDNKKEIRRNYIISQLLPPNGKTACDNIINSIIGEE